MEEGWKQFFGLAGIPEPVAKKYAKSFVENRIRSAMLADLDRDTLVHLGITAVGDQLAVLRRIRDLSKLEEMDADETAQPPSAAVPSQITNVANAPKTTATQPKKVPTAAPQQKSIRERISAPSESDTGLPPVPKRGLVAPDKQEVYNVKMPSGTTPKTQRILQTNQTLRAQGVLQRGVSGKRQGGVEVEVVEQKVVRRPVQAQQSSVSSTKTVPAPNRVTSLQNRIRVPSNAPASKLLLTKALVATTAAANNGKATGVMARVGGLAASGRIAKRPVASATASSVTRTIGRHAARVPVAVEDAYEDAEELMEEEDDQEADEEEEFYEDLLEDNDVSAEDELLVVPAPAKIVQPKRIAGRVGHQQPVVKQQTVLRKPLAGKVVKKKVAQSPPKQSLSARIGGLVAKTLTSSPKAAQHQQVKVQVGGGGLSGRVSGVPKVTISNKKPAVEYVDEFGRPVDLSKPNVVYVDERGRPVNGGSAPATGKKSALAGRLGGLAANRKTAVSIYDRIS